MSIIIIITKQILGYCCALLKNDHKLRIFFWVEALIIPSPHNPFAKCFPLKPVPGYLTGLRYDNGVD